MEINNISTNNFKGTFVLKPKTQQVREAIPNIIKKGRQIFYNIKSEGDVVIVTKDKYDRRIKDFITKEKLHFSYYPEINTSCGLDDQMPIALRALMDERNNCVVKNLRFLNKFFAPKELHLNKQSEYIQKALNTLRLNTDGAKVQINECGTFFVRDDARQRTILTSGFKDGIAYFYIKPDHIAYQDSRRVLVGKNGQEIIKEFETPKDWKIFNKAFQA